MKVKKIYTNSKTDKEINCRVRDTAHSTWPRPRTATASWSFLRFRGHFELYIADCSKLAHPLNKLLSGYTLAANNLKGKHNNHYPNRSEAFVTHTRINKHMRAHTHKNVNGKIRRKSVPLRTLNSAVCLASKFMDWSIALCRTGKQGQHFCGRKVFVAPKLGLYAKTVICA